MSSHTALAKFIHWTFTLLYAYGIFKQVDDLTELEDASLLNFEILFATIFLIITIVRYIYMKDTPVLLGANDHIPKGHLFIAKTVHRLVYFSLIMLPVTGLLIAGLFNLGMGGIEVAIIIHEFSAFLSYVVIALHVIASLYSRFKGEGMWSAMVPIWKETKKNDSDLVSRLEVIENNIYKKVEKRITK
ncbi:MAG: cytochrome B [Euryarchaeota archaeon]|nr:cytochrome B [Euryarchaeota archaeon]|tara:strand:+ start:194 stop:757 length:564 start_codon:yes stop_codon:yes gene_type:complete